MSGAQKTHLALSLNRFAQGKVLEAIALFGQALPCQVASVSGSIVTVSFQVTSKFTLPNVTMPVAMPEYIRLPIQVGDKGVTFPADARLGGISGLGGGTADLSVPANLSALVFMPVSNQNWAPVTDPNKVVLYGPNGGVLMSSDASVSLTMDKTTTRANVIAPGGLWINGVMVTVP